MQSIPHKYFFSEEGFKIPHQMYLFEKYLILEDS